MILARELLGRVGENLELQDKVKDDMKAFVLSKVYDERADTTCGHARASKWHKMKKKSTARLPPDDDTLNQHVKRTNYITYCQLHYNLIEHPSPIGHGWEIMNGKCKPVRHTSPALPDRLKPRDSTGDSSNESSDDDSESSDDDSEVGESTDSDE
jgi:hypothetical protein